MMKRNSEKVLLCLRKRKRTQRSGGNTADVDVLAKVVSRFWNWSTDLGLVSTIRLVLILVQANLTGDLRDRFRRYLRGDGNVSVKVVKWAIMFNVFLQA